MAKPETPAPMPTREIYPLTVIRVAGALRGPGEGPIEIDAEAAESWVGQGKASFDPPKAASDADGADQA